MVKEDVFNKESFDFKALDDKLSETENKSFLAIAAAKEEYETISEFLYDLHIMREMTSMQISLKLNRMVKKKQFTLDSIRYLLESKIGIYQPVRTFKKKPLDGARKICHVDGCNAKVAPGNYWLCANHAAYEEHEENKFCYGDF